jgi:hypothetical protein
MVMGFLAAMSVISAGCSTRPALPPDARISAGRIASRQYLTTVNTERPSSSGAGIGFGGVGAGGLFGVGMGFDITRLFEKPDDSPTPVYRYAVQLQDGSLRSVDSVLDLPIGGCVAVLDSGQPGFPELRAARDCE